MRAAWGALKGAVQELNDALLEEDDDDHERSRRSKYPGHITYSRERNDHVVNDDFSSNINLKKSNFGLKKNLNPNDNKKDFITSHKGKNSLSSSSYLNDSKRIDLKGNLPLEYNQYSNQNIIILQDSESSKESNSITDEEFDWGLDTESTLKGKLDSKTNQFFQKKQFNQELSQRTYKFDSGETEEKSSDIYTETNKFKKIVQQSNYSKDDGYKNNDELMVENNFSNNGEGESVVVTEDDEGSNITDALEDCENKLKEEEREKLEEKEGKRKVREGVEEEEKEEEEEEEEEQEEEEEEEEEEQEQEQEQEEEEVKTVSNSSDDEDLRIFNLPSKYSKEFSEIFQMEIGSVDYLLEVIQGYYSDWNSIMDSLISDRELLIELAPPHYESYLKNTILNKSKPFSLGFTVLIGQCVCSFLQEFKKKASLIDKQENKINELFQKCTEYSTNSQNIEAENNELSKKISVLEDEINFLREKNEELLNKIEDDTKEKDQKFRKRLEDLEIERNNLIEKINQMIEEKSESKIEVDKLHEHINNLTNIIEGYQAEEEQISSRYEVELERARSEEKKLQTRLSVLDSCQDEINSLKDNIAKLEEDRNSLERRVGELVENNNNLLNSNEQIMKQLQDTKEEQKEFMIDKRFIIQIIQKHNEDGSRIKYRNDLFNLLCDVIGLSQDERSNLFISDNRNSGSNSRENLTQDLNQGMGFADLFYNFLNSEVEESMQEAK
ncbi:hypothetical protein CmeUKMEL1_11555 [Cryptosporidium meleagridis]|uniref:Uncharacterized protein n=1 Tax=Cryptosporidium meleagridis TaxID=93969 RepID=A0A2P4Z2R2_9CRYT|nr:hypothetical protein CmeUKMEL1_11555 [Cryptosporidium meleagridis]